jgi:hypothetical protein
LRLALPQQQCKQSPCLHWLLHHQLLCLEEQFKLRCPRHCLV